VSKADVAKDKLFEIIDRHSPLDYTSREGLGGPEDAAGHEAQQPERQQPLALQGRVDFFDVSFAYPARPEHLVLRGFSCSVSAGQTVAFVGASGSGKSTIIKLLERFYLARAGRIAVDGVDIERYNLAALRRAIGLCGQEPVLFQGSVMDNVAMGLLPTDEQRERKVIAACKAANAHDFVMAFPEGYATQCGGSQASQLSGGQKQRLGIARAIVNEPAILCLDESTSALDNESERIVQAALDALMAARRRTTLIVAHRLSTIKGADRIVVLDQGRIAEQGTHAELVAIKGGKFNSLQRSQAH
jgi:ATP-binding cassette subfamily B (MDR/TAP) protein 1